MIATALSAVYGAAATWRRRWYANDQARQRRLSVPVISVGNLRVGGSGKTPTVQCLARLLQARGERPAILSRGYARSKAGQSVTIVSDPHGMRADVDQSGDEPLLLARSLPGVPVVVCPNRFRAGLEAERLFSPTLHILDDGFQHLALARDIDLLLVDEEDLSDRVLPAGRLREPLANAASADAVIVSGILADTTRSVARRLHVQEAFTLTRRLGLPQPLSGTGAPPPGEARLFAVAGIARPDRFFRQLTESGYQLVGSRAFPDHHVYAAGELADVASAARAASATAVITTEKDAVRIEKMAAAAGMPILVVPLLVEVEPPDRFSAWVRARLDDVRSSRVSVS